MYTYTYVYRAIYYETSVFVMPHPDSSCTDVCLNIYYNIVINVGSGIMFF